MRRKLLCILFVLLTLTAAAKGKDFILCIDPGHGGHDAGAVGLKAKEKDINLSVALAFGKLVEQKCKDVKVIYTRTTDVFVTLQGRADIANAAHADLFISVHTNSVPDGHWAYGSETYALGKNSLGTNYSVVTSQGRVTSLQNGSPKQEAYNAASTESAIAFDMLHAAGLEQGALLAQCIQHWYAKAGRVNKGVKEGVWLVLRRTVMPAVLTELGFISTPDEEDYLISTNGVQTLARCLYNGFIDYRNALDHQKRKTLNLNAAPSPKPRQNPQMQQPTTSQTTSQATPQTTAPTAPQQPAQLLSQPQNRPQQQPVQQTQQQPKPQAQQPKTQSQQPKPQQSQSQPTRQQQPQPQNAAQPKVCFKVQVFSMTKELKSDDPQLKGLKDVTFYKENDLFKYTTGIFTNVADARKYKTQIADTFPGAFVVAFVDGKRVSVQEAIDAQKK